MTKIESEILMGEISNLSSNGIIEVPFFNNKECEKLIKYVDKKEEYFIKNEDEAFASSIYNKEQITSANFYRYNFFVDNSEYIDRFLVCLKEILPWLKYPIAIQAWVNIYKTGEGIKWHNHAGLNGHSYTANIFLRGETQPGTIYTEPGKDDTIIENIVGVMLLSNCCMWHKVPLNESNVFRYSIGITIHDYEAITNELLFGVCFNAPHKGIILLKDE